MDSEGATTVRGALPPLHAIDDMQHITNMLHTRRRLLDNSTYNDVVTPNVCRSKLMSPEVSEDERK